MTQEEKHTLGPWDVNGPRQVIKVDELAIDISMYANGKDAPDSEYIANARLISAAPDLLLALESFVNDLPGDMSAAMFEKYRRHFECADAAIAKARLDKPC